MNHDDQDAEVHLKEAGKVGLVTELDEHNA